MGKRNPAITLTLPCSEGSEQTIHARLPQAIFDTFCQYLADGGVWEEEQAKSLGRHLGELLNSQLPSDYAAPTAKQRKYAQVLAEGAGLDPAAVDLSTKAATSAFIAQMFDQSEDEA